MPNDYEKIYLIILAILLVFVIPILLRRHGMDYSDLAKLLFRGGGRQDPDSIQLSASAMRNVARTSGNHALTEYAGKLLAFSRRHKTGLIYPGTVSHHGETATLLAIVVTKSEAIGVNCFGFAGNIRDTGTRDKWLQKTGDKTSEIPNPLAANAIQDKLVRTALNENGMTDIPYRTVAVFTSAQAVLHTTHPDDVMSGNGFITFLKELCSEETDRLDPDESARRIHTLVRRLSAKNQRQATPSSSGK